MLVIMALIVRIIALERPLARDMEAAVAAEYANVMMDSLDTDVNIAAIGILLAMIMDGVVLQASVFVILVIMEQIANFNVLAMEIVLVTVVLVNHVSLAPIATLNVLATADVLIQTVAVTQLGREISVKYQNVRTTVLATAYAMQHF